MTDSNAALLSKLLDTTTLIALATGLAYVVGWSFCLSYFSHFGAGWFVHLLPTKSVLQSSYVVLAPFVIAALFFTYGFLKAQALYKLFFAVAFLALLGSIVAVAIPKGWLPHYDLVATGHFLGGMAAIALVASALPPLMMKRKLSLRTLIDPFHIAILIILVTGPYELGKFFAIRNSDAFGNTLPRANIDGDSAWRILSSQPDKTLLIKLGKTPRENVFRIVEPEKIESIGFGVGI